MANITRIKARETVRSSSKDITKKDLRLVKETDKRVKKAERKEARKAQKESNKKPFVLFRPFIVLGHYLKDSWVELRQVRWPNRKATWKMVLAIFVYTALFSAFLVVMNLLFDLIFNKLLG